MGSASFLQTSFVAGEWSLTAQGDIKDPRYKAALGVCLNEIAIEAGAVTRRSGTQFCGTTRGGAAGRLVRFDFEQDAPYGMEFTDGYLRFWAGSRLATTNDQQVVASISAANPAKVATTKVHGWTSGNTVQFNTLSSGNPLLQNRAFIATVTSTTEFTLTDAVTGATIDGSTLGAFVSGNVTRVLEFATSYQSGAWAALRSVQAELKAVLVNGTSQPQLLGVLSKPLPNADATFNLSAFTFADGPYLDPIAGAIVTPSATNGVITLTLTTQAYDSTRAYNLNDFVTDSGVSYQSISAANQGHTPASSSSNWRAVNAGSIVGANGFVSSDIGRLIRLYSEPQPWVAGTYAAAATVSFPSTTPGVNVYYTSLVGSNADVPGTSTKWALTPTIARWTWGTITGVSGVGLITPVSAVGTMTAGGGVAAAFDGNNVKSASASASFTASITSYPLFVYNSGAGYNPGDLVYYQSNWYTCQVAVAPYVGGSFYANGQCVSYQGNYWRSQGTNSVPNVAAPWTFLGTAIPQNTNIWAYSSVATQPSYDVYVGQHYTVAKAIYQATLYPASDTGFADTTAAITLTLRAKATAPASPSDGTLLGTTTIANTTSAVTIPSNDTVTTWNYVWIEITTQYLQPLTPNPGNVFTAHISIAQALFYTPNVANGSVITVQVQGDALLYTGAIYTWRIGVYSDTTGWPTCGVYHEGRLWLSGAVGNRVDSSKSGSINNFAPTDKYGAVAADNAISYTFDAKDVNAIFWMDQDQQGIICGTQAGEWLVQASSLNNPLTPTNIQAHRVTHIGCANIEPRRTEHTLVFVQKHRRKIMEYFADVYSGKFSAPNLSEKARHLTKPNIAELAYQQELAPIIWARCDDGSFYGMTYRRETLASSQGPTFNAAHRHRLGSSRTVESICVGPTSGGTLETLMMVTNDLSTNVRHIEMLTNLWEEGNLLTTAWLLDDAVAPSSYGTAIVMGGASGITFNGLWHLNGKTVTVFAGGLDVGDWAVSNGSVSVPFAPSTLQTNVLFTAAFVTAFAGIMPVVIGFTYTSQGQLLRPDTNPESGARNGPGFAKMMRLHKFAASLVDTQAISFGTDFAKMRAATLKTTGKSAALAVNVLFNGLHKDVVGDAGDIDGSRLAWQQTRPFPGTIAGIGGFLQTQDE